MGLTSSLVAGSIPAIPTMEKLYIIVRNDISPGLQCAQACHAQHAFAQAHPQLIGNWKGNLVVLQVSNEEDLQYQLTELDGFPTAWFFEPDLDGELTAIAVAGDAERLLSSLSLALRQAA